MKRSERGNLLLLAVLAAGGFLWFIFRLRTGSLRMISFGEVFTYLLFAPVAEELFFRGVLQDSMKKKLTGGIFFISFANIVVSAMFALLHMPLWGVLHGGLVFVPSLMFGLLYDRTQRVVYPIILHIVYNFNVFIT